uniref:Uncharacterized protein n=1 Tax=Arundo donax TaxID=35708 RepID=A0A0A9FIQ7_ARUDO
MLSCHPKWTDLRVKASCLLVSQHQNLFALDATSLLMEHVRTHCLQHGLLSPLALQRHFFLQIQNSLLPSDPVLMFHLQVIWPLVLIASC